MKKKLLLTLLLCLALCFCTLTLNACGSNPQEEQQQSGQQEQQQGQQQQSGQQSEQQSEQQQEQQEQIVESQGLEFSLNADGESYSVMGIGTCTDTEIVIPTTYNEKPVTSIGEGAFCDCSNLTKVTIGNNVKTIERGAFYNCRSITEVIIGDSVTSVGEGAFYNSINITKIVIPDSIEIEYIGRYAFSGCSKVQFNEYDNALYLGNDRNPYVVLFMAKNESIKTCEINNNCKIIYNFAFSDCSSLTSVTIPDSVKSIGEYAFYGCSSLTKVTIPDSVEYIGEHVFEDCNSLEEITMPVIGRPSSYYIFGGLGVPTSLKKVVITGGEIGDRAFYDCRSLTEVVIGDSVTSIGESAFYNCSNLTKVTIGDSVTSIGYCAFSICSSLTEVIIPDSVTSIGKYAFSNCSGLTSVTIGNSVKSIGEYAFYGCSSLTRVNYTGTIDQWVQIEGLENLLILSYYPYAHIVRQLQLYINGQLLTEAKITKATKINAYAFVGCIGLTSVTIGNSVTSIGEGAFEYCIKLVEVINLSSLNITKGSKDNGYVGLYALNIKTSGTSEIVNVNDYLFYTYDNVNYLLGYVGSDTELVLPDNYNGESYEIYMGAFYNCSSLTSVTIGNSVEAIGEGAFYECFGLTSVTIGSNVEAIGDYAFEECYKLVEVINLSSLNIEIGSENNGYVGYYALNIKTSGESEIVNKDGYLFYTYDNVNYLLGYVGSDTELVLPDNYNGQSYEIYMYAFSWCSNLTKVTIPDSVTSIGEGAFSNCGSLKRVNYTGTIDEWVQINFEGLYANPLCYAKNLYINGVLITKANIITATKINDYAFYNCIGLTSVTIPDSVEVIGSSAFYNCSSLTSVTIGNSVKSIGYRAFEDCRSLTSVTIPDSVTSIGNWAFYNCSSLTEITIPNSVEAIGYCAFYGCSIEEATIPTTEISHIFGISSPLKKLVITGGESIEAREFEDCRKLTSVTIEDGVEVIGEYAFRFCSSLTEVVIGNSVTSIGYSAFENCSSLTSVTIGNSVTSIGVNAFSGCNSLQYNEYDNALYLGNNQNQYLVLIKAKNTSITTCEINNECKIISGSAFRGCSSLTSVTIPDSVEVLGDGAFMDCSNLTSVTIGNSVTNIGYDAFYNCSSLTSVTIPDSVEVLGEGAFYNCSSLTSINVHNNNGYYKSIDGNLYSKDGKTLIQYAIGKTATSFTIPDSVEVIGDYAFYYCSSLTSVTIGDSVKSIGDYAFYGCSSLTSVTIGDSVTNIGDDAFEECSSLTNITFNGTKAEWQTIEKGRSWKYNVPATVVHCSDGDVTL